MKWRLTPQQLAVRAGFYYPPVHMIPADANRVINVSLDGQP